MNTPASLVSVIIATYRGGEFLRQTIASVLAQSCGDFEVLVADDGNDAETRDIVRTFADARLVYTGNPTPLGPAGNHWATLRRTRGEFLAILNHDDLWKPDFLRRTLAGFEGGSHIVTSFCDHDVIDAQGQVLPDRTAGLSRRTGRDRLAAGVHHPFFDLAVECAIPIAQAAVFRKSALDLSKLPEVAGPAYDFWLNYLLARTEQGAFYLPEKLASWRTHETAISRATTRSDWPAGGAACWDRIADDPLFAPYHRLARHRSADLHATAALADLRGNRRPEAWHHAMRAVARHAFAPRVAAIFLLSLLPRFVQTRLLRG